VTEAIRANCLRIHRGPDEDDRRGFPAAYPAAERLCRSFRAATGWPLHLVPAERLTENADPLWSAPVDPGQGNTPGYLTIGPSHDAGRPGVLDLPACQRVPIEHVTELAGSLAELLQELLRARAALVNREAELSMGVPVTGAVDTPMQLAMRLEMVLRGGAEGIGCHAAGLYLLDAATTQLKLRSYWGIPPDRLADPARTLQGAVGDLEALTGHAIVLENRTLFDYWNVPEPCEAAVCVPVSTSTTLLGTLWIFSEDPRSFSDREVNLAEIVAGRLAVELERETLLHEAVASVDQRGQCATAQALLQTQLPATGPQSDAWEVSGWAAADMVHDSACYDWFPAAGHQLGVAICEPPTAGLAGALAAQSVRASLRAHAVHAADPAELLSLTNIDLWRSAAGDQFAAVLCAAFDPDDGKRVRLSAAGSIGVWRLSRDGAESVVDPHVPLGVEPASTYVTTSVRMAPGECLVAASGALYQRFVVGGQTADHVATILGKLGDADRETADRLQRAVLQRIANDPPAGALWVLRRRDLVLSDRC